MRAARLVAFLFVALCFVAVAVSAQPPEQTVVARLSPEAYARLEPHQVLRSIDYGGFVWVEMTQEQADGLQRAGIPYEPQPFATYIGLQEYAFDTREGEPALPSAMRVSPRTGQEGLQLVQFVGPVRDDWLADISAAGLRPVQYVAQNAYVAWGSFDAQEKVARKPFVRWLGPFHTAYKLADGLLAAEGVVENVNVVIYDDGHVKSALQAIGELGGRYIQAYPLPVFGSGQVINAIFALDAARLPEVARLPNVLRLEYAPPRPGLDDEVSAQIVAGNHAGGIPYPGYYGWLASLGVDGSGTIIADVDTGCDTNDSATAHADIRGRIAAFVDYSDGYYLVDYDGHGTHTAGLIAGNASLGIADPRGSLYGLGVAPAARLVVQNALLSDWWPPLGGWQALSRDSVLYGAVASSNSWYTGAYGAQGYSSACAAHDRMVRDANWETTAVAEPLVMIFSAGNSGPGSRTITEPKEAKNLIVVGASENYRPDTPLGLSCGASSDIERVVSFSSRGPCLDGRRAPLIVAPGSQVASLRSYFGYYHGCAMPVSGQPDYVYMSGTSMSCPLVAGAVALIAQWWQGMYGMNPSPAMVKALLVNGATDIGSADIPNNAEGWGRLNLANIINNGRAMVYRDQDHLFTQSGEVWSLRGAAADPTVPLKVTLAWTDAPGPVGGWAWVNDLDLEVILDGVTYKGNSFASGWSVPGGVADHRNNVECVYIPNPGRGQVTIRVLAANVSGDGVPYNGDETDQDFALVAYNMALRPDFSLAVAPTSRVACAPGVVTYSLAIGSIMGYTGTVSFSLSAFPPDADFAFMPSELIPPSTATLLITTTDATPDGFYPMIITATGQPSYTHSAEVALTLHHATPPSPSLLSPADGETQVPLQPTFCWSSLPEALSYTLQLSTDSAFGSTEISASGLLSNSFSLTSPLQSDTVYFWRVRGWNGCGEGPFSAVSSFRTLRLYRPFCDDMESGPAKWSHAATLGSNGWTLSTASAHSPIHAWFAPDSSYFLDDHLWTTQPFIVGPDAVLTFWHQYSLERGYDGGVLELSFDGGATWVDLGPYIRQGGYSGVISYYFGNPIAGRAAWSGSSGGWREVAVDLSSFVGAPIQLRWRLACDVSIRWEGWRVDDVCVTSSEPGPGRVSGLVWLDSDPNGFPDVWEPGVSNVEVALFDSEHQVRVARTDAVGRYRFEGLLLDCVYSVRPTLPPGYSFTTASSLTVTLTSQQPSNDSLSFGLSQGFLTVRRWHDRLCPGWGQRYDIALQNPLDYPLTEIVVRANLPRQVRFSDTTPPGGTTTGGAYDPYLHQVLWHIGELSPFDTRSMHLHVYVLSNVAAAGEVVVSFDLESREANVSQLPASFALSCPATPTLTPTCTASATPSSASTFTLSPATTPTATGTATASRTPKPSWGATETAAWAATSTHTATLPPSSTCTPTATRTATETATSSASSEPSASPSVTHTPTATRTPKAEIATPTLFPTVTMTPTLDDTRPAFAVYLPLVNRASPAVSP